MRDLRVTPPVTQGVSVRRYGLVLGVAAAVVVVDRLTKLWAEQRLPGDPITVVDGLLSFSYAENPGAAFGLFRSGGPFLAVAAAVAAVVILVAVRTVEDRREVFALGLILGGSVGNLIDRLVRGAGLVDGRVVDWIEFPNFPNFNVADSAITVGAVFLVLVGLLTHRRVAAGA